MSLLVKLRIPFAYNPKPTNRTGYWGIYIDQYHELSPHQLKELAAAGFRSMNGCLMLEGKL